jgi:hypothetical protein
MIQHIFFLFFSCEKNRQNHLHIEYMCLLLNIENYFIVIGTQQDTYIDKSKLYIKCNDNYESFPEKVFLAMRYVYKNIMSNSIDLKYIAKIDDDVYLHDLSFLQFDTENDYIIHQKLNSGKMNPKWHYNKCSDSKYNIEYKLDNYLIDNNLPIIGNFDYGNGGAVYLLSKNALNTLCNHTHFDILMKYMYEDVIVAYILGAANILPCINMKGSFKNYIYNSNNCLFFRIDCKITLLKIKYLYMEINGSEGLNDRKARLLALLQAAKMEKRIAIVPKMILTSLHDSIGKKNIHTYLINEYFRIEDKQYQYVLYDDNLFKNDNDIKVIQLKLDTTSNYTLNQTLCSPMPRVVMTCKDQANILHNNNKQLIGLHIRKTDKLSIFENEYLSLTNILHVIEKSIHNLELYNIFIATDDKSMLQELENKKTTLPYNVYVYNDFDITFKDNYELFLHEMYIVETADIRIKTFKDSEYLYNFNKPDSFYYFLDRSMHNPVEKYTFSGTLLSHDQ